jgi:hypothetical protein
LQAAITSSQGRTTQEERLKKYNQPAHASWESSSCISLSNSQIKREELFLKLMPHLKKKIKQPVEEILKSKHPETRKPAW